MDMIIDEEDLTDEEILELIKFHNQVDTDSNWASLANIDFDANIPTFGQFSHMILDEEGFEKKASLSDILLDRSKDDDIGLAKFESIDLWKIIKKNGKYYFVKYLKDGEVHQG